LNAKARRSEVFIKSLFGTLVFAFNYFYGNKSLKGLKINPMSMFSKPPKDQFRHCLQVEIFNAVEEFARMIGKMEADKPLAEAFGRVPEDIRKDRMLAEMALDDVLNLFVSVISDVSLPPPLGFYARLLQLRNGGALPDDAQAKTSLVKQFNAAGQRDTKPLFIECIKNDISGALQTEMLSQWNAIRLQMQGLKLTEQQLEATDYTAPARSFKRPQLALVASN
jgi:hypothetical protein